MSFFYEAMPVVMSVGGGGLSVALSVLYKRSRQIFFYASKEISGKRPLGPGEYRQASFSGSSLRASIVIPEPHSAVAFLEPQM